MKKNYLNSLFTIFALTYTAVVMRRSASEIWSLSKSSVKVDLSFSSTILGTFDAIYLVSYSFGEYANGILCNRYGEDLMVSIGIFFLSISIFTVMSIKFSVISLFKFSYAVIFGLLWAFQGYFHSAVRLT